MNAPTAIGMIEPFGDDPGALRVSSSGTRDARWVDEKLIRARLRRLDTERTILVSGCCIGWDEATMRIARELGLRVYGVVPANISRVFDGWRSLCADYERMPVDTDYRARNMRVLDLGRDLLLAGPAHAEADPRSQRSGTWQTIRAGLRRGMPVEVYVLSEMRRNGAR